MTELFTKLMKGHDTEDTISSSKCVEWESFSDDVLIGNFSYACANRQMRFGDLCHFANHEIQGCL